MFVEFFNLMFIAAFIFGGFLYALWTCVSPASSCSSLQLMISSRYRLSRGTGGNE